MQKANNFFFLSDVSENVKCDFVRSGDKIILSFCDEGDKEERDRLEITIRTEKSIDHVSGKELKRNFISYVFNTGNTCINQGESKGITYSPIVWPFVIAIVNDAFKR